MKIIINYSPPGSTSQYETELTSNPNETWGQLTQRYIEHYSLHPPQLLLLLKSLNQGGSANKCQLRYGDGYATNCRVTWNASRSSAAGKEFVDDEMIEVNITLKPLTGTPLANTSLGKVSDISTLVIADSVPTKVKTAALEISIELVGLPNPNSDIKMTQTPFPIDMDKVNVLDIVEHRKFEGVVDQYSLKKCNESGEGGVAATPMSSRKKRKESTSASATASTTTKKTSAAAAAAAAASTMKKEKKKDKSTATTSSKKQKTVKDANDGEDGTAEKTPKKSTAAVEETTEKKKSKKKKKKSSDDEDKAGPTGTVKKSRKSSDKGEDADEATLPVAESSPPKSSKKEKKKKKKSKGKENDEDEDEEETSPTKAKVVPKRPLNAYMLYGNTVRQQVKDSHPELKPTEVTKKIGEMYRGLSPEELQKWKDTATANMTKFKEEWGEDALKQSTKKKIKKKEDVDEDVATDVAKVSTKKDKAEESDDESESEDDGEVIPKPPGSAYMDYSAFIRPKLKEENPDASPTEMMKLLGAAYKALDEDTLQKFKDKADKNMAEYKAKYGEDAVAKSRRKAKKDKKKKDKDEKKRKSSATAIGGDEGGDESPKKKKQKSSNTGAAASPKRTVILDQPAIPAEGLPSGWKTRSVPRKTGNHVDKYFYSPAKEYKFASKPKVLQFLECMVTADNDEVAAMKLYKEKEKKKKGTAATPKKKSKSVEAETVVVAKKATDSDSDDSSSDGSLPEEADAKVVVKEADNSDSSSQSSEGSAPTAWAA